MYRKKQFVTKYNYGNNIVDLDEYVISFATSCNLGCEYCYLKFVKAPRCPHVYDNTDILYSELEQIFSSSVNTKTFYFNCGETTDTLLTEKHIKIVSQIIKLLAEFANKYNKKISVELRTKTKKIFNHRLTQTIQVNDDFLTIVYTTSISPEFIIQKFEKNTATLNERISTLKYAAENNFCIGLRFEPIILFPVKGISYEDICGSIDNLVVEYKNIINHCYEKIWQFKDKIHSISFSCLRFTKNQYKQLKRNRAQLCFPEMVLCPDRKYRYSRPIRTEIYQQLIQETKNVFSDNILDKIFLATEFEYLWNSCGLIPRRLADYSN